MGTVRGQHRPAGRTGRAGGGSAAAAAAAPRGAAVYTVAASHLLGASHRRGLTGSVLAFRDQERVAVNGDAAATAVSAGPERLPRWMAAFLLVTYCAVFWVGLGTLANWLMNTGGGGGPF